MFDFQAGSFSYYEENNGNGNFGTLYLGDGESYSFYLEVAEPNAKLSDVTVTFAEGVSSDTKISAESYLSNDYDDNATKPHIYFYGSDRGNELIAEITDENGVKHYRIGHNYDYIEYCYKILHATAPSEDGKTPVPNWKSSLQWCFRNKKISGQEEDIAGLKPNYAPLFISPASNYSAFMEGWFYACYDEQYWEWRGNPIICGPIFIDIKPVYRIELPEEVGKEYTLEQFHRIFWWWCIGTYETGKNDYCISSSDINGNEGVYKGFGGTGTWYKKNDTYTGYNLGAPGVGQRPESLSPHVMTENVTAVYGPTSKTNSTNVGTCQVCIKYSSTEKNEQSVYFNIVVQKRNCVVNLSNAN